MQLSDDSRLAPSSTARANSLADLTATEFIKLFRSGQVNAIDYARACADRIEQFDGQIKAFHRWDRGLFEARATRIDSDWRKRRRELWMPGVPVGIKDVFNTYDFPTGMGSEILNDYTPGNDARVVSNIRLEGGIVAGKTVTAEFAVHHPGPTVNPHDPRRSPGTSSSGSAAAVACRMVPLAIGTQTAGSVIRPASYCGTIGWKPSFGLLPRTAMLKTTDTLDSVGLFARSLDDIELLFEVCRVRGHNYPVSDTILTDVSRQTVSGRPLRIALLNGPKRGYESAAAREAFDGVALKLSTSGAEIVPYSLPAVFEQAHEIHERMYRRSLAYYFKVEWAQCPEMFSKVLADMIRDGIENISPADYARNIRIQSELAHTFDREMTPFDALICLATADEAPMGLDGRDLPDHCLIFTMVGASTMSLPILRGKEGLPVGLQVVTRKYEDYKLLTIARRFLEVAT